MSGAEDPEDEGPSSPTEAEGPSSPSEDQSSSSPCEAEGPSSPSEDQSSSILFEPEGPSSPNEAEGPSSQSEAEGPSSPTEDQSSSSPCEAEGPSSPSEDQSSSILFEPEGPSSPNEAEGPSSQSEAEGPSSPNEDQGSSTLFEVGGPSSPSEDQSPSTPFEAEGPSSPSEAPESVGSEKSEEFMESVVSHIEQRIEKLRNRLLFLQQVKQVIRRAEDTHEAEGASELELVERELQDLLRQKQILCNKTFITPRSTGQARIEVEGEVGIYTLPPLHFTSDTQPADPIPPEEPPLPPEEPPLPPEEPPVPPEEPLAPPEEPEEPLAPPEEPYAPPEELPAPLEEELQEDEYIKQIKPAEGLGKVGAFTLCPSCEQVVFTQTKTFNGEAVWLVSCLMGFLGLCFVAFCLDKLKSVQHKCPQCQTTIHTHHPM